VECFSTLNPIPMKAPRARHTALLPSAWPLILLQRARFKITGTTHFHDPERFSPARDGKDKPAAIDGRTHAPRTIRDATVEPGDRIMAHPARRQSTLTHLSVIWRETSHGKRAPSPGSPVPRQASE
jgi:hypothetical protein